MFRIFRKDNSVVIFECPDIPDNNFIAECIVKYGKKKIAGIKWDKLDFEADGFTKQEIIDIIDSGTEKREILKTIKSRLYNLNNRLTALENKQQKIIDELKEAR